MIEVKKYKSIHDVPPEWDSLIGDNIYLSREFESFMESVDSCNQEYYMLYNDGQLSNVFMSYDRKHYNLGMFTRFNLYGPMKLFYVPLSVTRPGIAGDGDLGCVMDYISKIRGRKMVLNLEAPLPDCDFAIGLTCPKCILKLDFQSFDDYMSRLRSSYRYRYAKAFERSSDLTLSFLEDNKDFDEELYNCYLQVYGKSRIRVEKLPIDFFRGPFFKIFVLRDSSGKAMGFTQLLSNGDELIFEFVGVNYEYNSRYDTYHRMLLEIVRYGIENGYRTIDFGQTADESKLKLGAEYTMLYACLHSSLRLDNAICKKLAKHIEYRPLSENFRVFKSK